MSKHGNIQETGTDLLWAKRLQQLVETLAQHKEKVEEKLASAQNLQQQTLSWKEDTLSRLDSVHTDISSLQSQLQKILETLAQLKQWETDISSLQSQLQTLEKEYKPSQEWENALSTLRSQQEDWKQQVTKEIQLWQTQLAESQHKQAEPTYIPQQTAPDPTMIQQEVARSVTEQMTAWLQKNDELQRLSTRLQKNDELQRLSTQEMQTTAQKIERLHEVVTGRLSRIIQHHHLLQKYETLYQQAVESLEQKKLPEVTVNPLTQEVSALQEQIKRLWSRVSSIDYTQLDIVLPDIRNVQEEQQIWRQHLDALEIRWQQHHRKSMWRLGILLSVFFTVMLVLWKYV